MTTTPRYLLFTHSLIPIVAIVTFVATVATLSVVTHLVLLGPNVSNYANHISALVSLPFFAFIFLGTWGILRYEGVSITDIGLGKSTFLPAVLAFGLLWGWIAVVGIGYLTATGATTAIGFSFDSPWYWVPVWFLLTLTLSNGLTEELVFRGYSKQVYRTYEFSLAGSLYRRRNRRRGATVRGSSHPFRSDLSGGLSARDSVDYLGQFHSRNPVRSDILSDAERVVRWLCPRIR